MRDDRADLMVKIRDQVNQEGGRLGIVAVDVENPPRRSAKADLGKGLQPDADRARAGGGGISRARLRTAQTITAKADRDVVVLRGDAQRQADQTRGEGDAERNRIFAEAYGKDPDFFAFYRSMQAYETGLKGGGHAHGA